MDNQEQLDTEVEEQLDDQIEESNEVEESDSQEKAISIRSSIRKALQSDGDESEEADVPEEAEEVIQPEEEEEAAAPAPEAQPQRPVLVPPADMNAAEKEAYLNPTPSNAHVLQQYMNRRAYETRSDYQRRVEEVENLRKQTSSIYDTIKQYEADYAKDGISLADVARRSIAWDREMQNNPVGTALDWLDSYGLSIQDLLQAQGYQQPANGQYPQQQNYQEQSYLTRQEAERIAEEKLQVAMQKQQEEQQQKAVAYYNERVVESFTASKPLFRDPETASQLEAEMAPIVQALTSTGRYKSPEEILETAYNYVVSGNPAFSSLHSAMTAKPKVEQRTVEAQKAKMASRSVSGSASSGTPRIVTKDIRDNLRRRLGGD
jgi:hypothetical protein